MKYRDKLSNDETKKADDVKKEKKCCDKDMYKVSGGNKNLRELPDLLEFRSTSMSVVAYGGPGYFGRKRLMDSLNARQEKQNFDPKDKSFPENNSDSSEK